LWQLQQLLQFTAETVFKRLRDVEVLVPLNMNMQQRRIQVYSM